MAETKSERFVRVGESRVNDVLAALDKLGKCADKRNYEYTPEQVDKVFATIAAKYAEVFQLFRTPEGRKRFTLSPDEDKVQEGLNFYNCLRLISSLVDLGVIDRDPEDDNHIMVYRAAGESNPEGWYSESPFDIAQELVGNVDDQQYLLDKYKELAGTRFILVDV